jgi:hypothetical protein
MLNILLAALAVAGGVATERLLASRLQWGRADRIFWAGMAAAGIAICWLKWIEPRLISAFGHMAGN